MNSPDVPNIGDQLSYMEAIVGRGFTGAKGDGASPPIDKEATEVTARCASVDLLASPANSVVANWGTTPAMMLPWAVGK